MVRPAFICSRTLAEAMTMRLAPLALILALTAPAAAQAPRAAEPSLSLGQETALRCSAVFGIIAGEQARKAPGANAYPPLGQRGREYFVRNAARLMDETGATREQVAAMMQSRVRQLQSKTANSPDPFAAVKAALTPCLVLLDAELPATPDK